MAVSKFCVMTEGRSGSTSLMEALASYADIAVPGKNIDCPDHELVHARHFEKYCSDYSRLWNKPIRSQADLITAFFALNDTDIYQFAGFKSMPNRHPDFAEFTARKDIRFITLQRRDIVSTTASFLTAMEKQSWRRHGEKWDEHWTFDLKRQGDAVRKNLQYIHESHQRLDSINGAIRLYYEDICSPGYKNSVLNDFFRREIAIRDPKTPTSAASYVSNIQELAEFVEHYWKQLGTGMVSMPAASIAAPRLPSAQSAMDASNVKSFCQFLGYPSSGATMLMAVLNAHPDILIGHQLRLATLFRNPLDLNQMAVELAGSVESFVNQGCKENDIDYTVPNQWQGRVRELKVIGNDSGTEAGLYLPRDKERLAGLQERLGLDLLYIHIYRNPFDNISIMARKGRRSIRQATQDYFAMAAGIQNLRATVTPEHLLEVCLEDMILEPETQLARVFQFLGVAADAGFIGDCKAAIFKSIPESRKRMTWKADQVSGIRKQIQKFPLLHRFLDEKYTPQVNLAAVRDSALLDEPTSVGEPVRRDSPASGIVRKYQPPTTEPSACIVYAWELGMDLGHIMRFLPLALKLREAGYKVVFAIRDLQHAETVIGNQGFEVLQAPIWQAVPKNLQNPPLNYAEIILRYGFLTAPGLTGLVRAWRNLFDYARASLVVIDHAPSALLASYTMGLKRVTIGHGFFSPPQVSPTPNMRPWVKVPDKRLVSSDRIALENSNQVIAALGGKPVERLSELFRVDAEFLCTFAELDHYPDRKGARYWGPGFNVDEGSEVDWSPAKGKKIFAYVKTSHRDFDRLMTTLQQSGANVLAYVPGITSKMAEKYQSARFRISQSPVRLKKLRNECDLAICHAGIGTVAAFLLSGKPVLLLPTQLEQFLVARRVEQLGAGLLVNTDIKDEKPDYKALLNRLLTEESFRSAARAFAAKYTRFQPDAQYQAMTNVIRKLLPLASPDRGRIA